MDMAPRRAEFMTAGGPWPAAPTRRSARSFEALHDGTRAALMMALVWPAIAVIPFFWAPPLWVMAAMTAGRK